LMGMKEDLKRIGKYNEYKIGLPRIGCGLGGAPWQIVQRIINDVFDDVDVYVYTMNNGNE